MKPKKAKKSRRLLKINRRIEHYRRSAEQQRKSVESKHRIAIYLSRLIKLTREKAPPLDDVKRRRYFKGLATALLSRREGSRKRLKQLLASLPKKISKADSVELLIGYHKFVLIEAAR